MWFHEYHFDGLRLDAVHAMLDRGAKHFLQELAETTDKQGIEDERKYFLIAESDLNDTRIITDPSAGGYGINCQWSDDFHHAIHALATGERTGYYTDFGRPEDVVKAFNESFVYDWRYSPYRKKTFGSNAVPHAPNKFVVSAQNHDQVGNRMLGERMSQLVSFEMLKLIAGAVLISPYIPMLFMGEEYGEQVPFQYFISHTDKDLIEAVRKGRAHEFASFNWQGDVPDPQALETFERCKLKGKMDGNNRVLFEYYRFLIELRKQKPAAKGGVLRSQTHAHQYHNKNIFIVIRESERSLVSFLNFDKEENPCLINTQNNELKKILDSADEKWGGGGSAAPEQIFYQQEIVLKPESIVIYETV
jgi:maltooligosyltrehalose trehalohydrolase